MEAMQSKSKEFNWELENRNAVQQLHGILSLLKEFDLESLLGEEIHDKEKLSAIAKIVFSDKAKALGITTALSNHADKIPNLKTMTDWIQMVSNYPDVVKASQLFSFNQYLSNLEALFAKTIVVNIPNGTLQKHYRTAVGKS